MLGFAKWYVKRHWNAIVNVILYIVLLAILTSPLRGEQPRRYTEEVQQIRYFLAFGAPVLIVFAVNVVIRMVVMGVNNVHSYFTSEYNMYKNSKRGH